MKQVISSEKLPIKLWLDDLESGALAQTKNLANLPFAFKHIPLMPDSHQGYGMPIGSVLATKDVVVPNAVGVDIGCGMCAMRTDLQEITTDQIKKTLGEARKRIPLGMNWHAEKQDAQWMPQLPDKELKIVMRHYEKAQKQVGSLGGGNHFVELQKGSDGYIWIMIHSGSRNLGYAVAKHYNHLAQRLNERFHSVVTPGMELAFLPIETNEAHDYMAEMNYCIAFALSNRKHMMHSMTEALKEVMGDFETDEIINKSHNFVAWEHHFNNNVLVHRKGATRAQAGELGMIPGSQGSSSFIVKGLGNADSFESCSHGAGRKMGRKQAVRELDLEAEIAHLESKGVVHGIRHAKDLDEAPSAYKNIDLVMENQTDLAEIVVELKPLGVLKG
ncbi:RtcB family protein [bacterium]|nr:RtcB family protein [bacterium]